MTREEILAFVAGLEVNQAPINNQNPYTHRLGNPFTQRMRDERIRRNIEVINLRIALAGHAFMMEQRMREIEIESLAPLRESLRNSSMFYIVDRHHIQSEMHELQIPDNSAPVPASPPADPEPNPMPLPRLEVDNQDVRNLEVNSESNRHSPLLNMLRGLLTFRNGPFSDVD